MSFAQFDAVFVASGLSYGPSTEFKSHILAGLFETCNIEETHMNLKEAFGGVSIGRLVKLEIGLARYLVERVLLLC